MQRTWAWSKHSNIGSKLADAVQIMELDCIRLSAVHMGIETCRLNIGSKFPGAVQITKPERNTTEKLGVDV